MISYVLSLPRASWKARAVAALFCLMGIHDIWSNGSHLHDDLAVVRWFAWFNAFTALLFLPMVLTICLLGRMPRSFARIPGGLNKTIPQIHAEMARQQQEERERSTWL